MTVQYFPVSHAPETFDEWRMRTAPAEPQWTWRSSLWSAVSFAATATLCLVLIGLKVALLLAALALLEVGYGASVRFLSAASRAVLRRTIGWGLAVTYAILVATGVITIKELLGAAAAAAALWLVELLLRRRGSAMARGRS